MTESTFNGHLDDFSASNMIRFNNGITVPGGVTLHDAPNTTGVSESTVDDMIAEWNDLGETDRKDWATNRDTNSPTAATMFGWKNSLGCPCDGD